MSIITTDEHTKLTNKLMEEMRDLLNSYFVKTGMTIVPTIGVVAEVDQNFMGIREIVAVVNTTIDKALYPSGLSTRSRKREIVIKRQIVSYVCKSLKFQLHHIGRSMFIDHATVLHGNTTVKNLLESNDPEMAEAYEKILTVLNAYHNEKYGKDFPKIN